MSEPNISGYTYSQSICDCSHGYLLPAISSELERLPIKSKSAFDLGCGSGSVANWMASQDFKICGVDPSVTGICEANKSFPNLDLQVGSAYESLSKKFGQFPLLLSLEVVEHVYAPREYAASIYDLLEPGGYALISTPYHGYIKNLTLALTGKMDDHFTALWDHGHIKFWSPKTITTLLTEAGLEVKKISRVGRIPPLAKSMLITVQKV